MYKIEAYRHHMVPAIKYWRKIRPNESILHAVNYIALSYECPLLVVCYLLKELEGSSDELERMIDRYMKFYFGGNKDDTKN